MNNYLETAISLVLIFFIFSIIAYVLQELLAINLAYRGKVLWKSLAQLFDEVKMEGAGFIKKTLPESAAPITVAFYNHPQIRSLRKNLEQYPSYIPSANFALAVMDEIASRVPPDQAAGKDIFQKIKLGLQTVVHTKTNGDIFTVLQNLVETSADARELQQKIEDWFNEYMNRVTGWYKSHTTLTLRIIAVGVTLFFNINVIKLTKQIFTDSSLRGSLTAMAEKAVDDPQLASYQKKTLEATADSIKAVYQPWVDSARTPLEKSAAQKIISDLQAKAADNYTKNRLATVDTLTRNLSISGLPIGWKTSVWDELKKGEGADRFWNIAWMLIGWAIGAGCISMGAPFWFDMLAKLVNVRRAGIIPDTGKK